MKKETLISIARVLIALALIAVLIFVIIYQNRDKELGGRIDVLNGGGEEARGIEGYSLGQTAPLGDKAVLLTTNTLILLDKNGGGDTVGVSLATPRASVRGKYIAAYDEGGKSFALYKNDNQVYALKAESEIISAVVNSQGYAAVACQESGGAVRITVYNGKGKAFYTWRLGSGQFVAMDLSDDNTNMVISSLRDEREETRGELTFVTLDKEDKLAAAVKKDEIYFDLRMNRDHTVLALGSEQLDYYNSDGTLRWSLPYDGKTLRCADIGDTGMAVLCYASVGSGLLGNSTQVEVVNRKGEITASTTFDGLCDCLSVNGGRFAASAGKKVYIYNEKCELEHELSSNSAVKKLSLYKNGASVFVLSGSGGSIISE